MNSRFSSQDRVWGLYHKDAKTAIPLKSLHASVSIVNTISRVKYTQNYYNDSDNIIETEFFFPISSDACFDSFEATFNDTTIRGAIKKKEQAKEEYKEAIAQGRTAAYSEINEETGDIMKIMIGNIPPKTTVGITYSYIQKLEIAANKFLCFRLFSTITPRYNGNLQDSLKADIALLSSYPTISSQDSEAYPWTIETEIQSASPISFVKSPSHDIAPVYGNENHTCKVTFKSKETQYPNKDFILLYTNENKQDKIDYMLTPFEEGYCAMINVRADFQTGSNEKVYENLVKAKEIESEYSMDEVKGEFVFLIDRSGSMYGDRIVMARDSLSLFLKSLPQDSWFDVVSFGDDYRSLNGVSLKYSQESLEQSVKQVERFEADMGGTEIYTALKRIFDQPIKTGYPRSVFLLTDGGVSNTSQVLNLIKANSDKSKVFTIGIGNGCSQELITQGATKGRGKHEFVANNSEVYEKVISLLNASLSPCYSDISLEGQNFDAVVKALTPNPSSIPLLLDGQTITFFLFLRQEAFSNESKMVLKLSMNDSRSHQRRSIDILLDTNEAMQNDSIPKLAVHDMIRGFETDKTKIVWMTKEDIKGTLVELSLKHGVLCKETAFFCETEKSNVKTVQDAEKIKIVVPAILSHDYDESTKRASKSYHTLSSSYRSAPPSSSVHSQVNEIQNLMAQNIDSLLMRSERLEDLSMKSCSLQTESMSFSKSAKKKESSGGFFGGIANAFGSLFSSKPSASTNSRSAEIPQPSYQQQQSAVHNFDAEFTCEDAIKCDMRSASPQDKGSEKVFADYAGFSYEEPESPKKLESPSVTSSGSYLQVVKQQKFEGFWDPQDSMVRQTILKNGALSEAPEEIKKIDAALAQTIWLTLLVLLWLETACQNERKAWLLIYQKGVNWLKKVGVNYEETKSLGTSEVKA